MHTSPRGAAQLREDVQNCSSACIAHVTLENVQRRTVSNTDPFMSLSCILTSVVSVTGGSGIVLPGVMSNCQPGEEGG